MIGHVDENRRAMLEVRVAITLNGPSVPVTTWIDTAFDGHLVLSAALVEELQLDPLAETEAVLADGSKVALQAFVCFIDWFGERMPMQVIANDGKIPLLGTGLLENRVLHIDYGERTVRLN